MHKRAEGNLPNPKIPSEVDDCNCNCGCAAASAPEAPNEPEALQAQDQGVVLTGIHYVVRKSLSR